MRSPERLGKEGPRRNWNLSFQGIARGRWRAGKVKWSGQARPVIGSAWNLAWVSHQIGTGWSWWHEH